MYTQPTTSVPRTDRECLPHPTNLLELVREIADVTDDDHEVVAAVVHLLRSGRVRRYGILRETTPDDLA